MRAPQRRWGAKLGSRAETARELAATPAQSELGMGREYGNTVSVLVMKATIDIPDELYRKVKAKSALLGKPVREVTVELFRQWVEGGELPATAEAGDWLEALRKLQVPPRTPGQTAREILEEGRKRLEAGS